MTLIVLLFQNQRSEALALVLGAQEAPNDSATRNTDLNRKLERSRKISVELTSHLPKGAILVGKDLPATVKRAVQELSSLYRDSLLAGTLTTQLIVIRDINRYLDYKGVVDKTQRDVIKRYRAAFTLDEQWPIYINGESELFSLAESRSLTPVDPLVYKLAGLIAHERVHAEGEPSEKKAIEEETRILQIFVVRGLLEMDWLIARKTKLAELINGKATDEPLKLKTIRISQF